MWISFNIILSLPNKQDWTKYEGIQNKKNPLKLYLFSFMKCDIYILSWICLKMFRVLPTCKYIHSNEQMSEKS